MKRVPTAKPGDEAQFQVAVRAVAQVALTDVHDEIQVIGLVPNAKDGARVFVGAGLRRADMKVPGNFAHQVNGALLDPAQALETAALVCVQARRAGVLRGQIIRPSPTKEMLDLVVFLIDSLPNDARMQIIDQAMARITADIEGTKPEKAN